MRGSTAHLVCRASGRNEIPACYDLRMSAKRGRKDHYLPQGYLRGFIDPARRNHQTPLWHFDVLNNRWSEKSVKQVGHRIGFYDYATTEAGFEPADVTFAELERNFPRIRDQIENNFDCWTDHLDFLLRFAQMMRARSLVFFEQKHEAWKNTPTWIVKEVLDDRTVRLESMTPKPPPDHFIKNRTIIEMQAEIKCGSAWAKDYHWSLRYTETPKEPFIICESPFVATDTYPPLLLMLPISWKACLYGVPNDRGYSKTEKVDLDSLRQMRKMYRQGAKQYLVSPTKLEL